MGRLGDGITAQWWIENEETTPIFFISNCRLLFSYLLMGVSRERGRDGESERGEGWIYTFFLINEILNKGI